VKPEKEKIKRVAVRTPNWLGDAVMAVPAIKALSRVLEPDKLILLSRGTLENLFSRYDFIDEVIPFSHATEAEAHRKLNEKGADALILLTNSFRSAWNGFKTGAKIRLGYGGNFRSFLLTHAVKKPEKAHMTDYYLNLAKTFGADDFPQTVEFPLTEAEKKFAESTSGLDGAIGIPLGARYGPAKRWPLENLSAFVRLAVNKTGRNIVLFGTASESGEAEKLAEPHAGRVINLTGKTTIGEMAAVMANCYCVVALDSGPLHVAGAVCKKVIALFGPTDPDKTAPRSENVKIIRGYADCAPCFKRDCPVGYICMKGITAEKVIGAIESN